MTARSRASPLSRSRSPPPRSCARCARCWMSGDSMLQQRDAILEAVAFAAERFLMTPDWEGHIQAVLARLGQRTNSSHVYIFENHLEQDGALVTSMRYEWAAPGIPPDIDN